MTMVEPAIAAATQDVENSALLSGYRLNVYLGDSKCSVPDATQATIEACTTGPKKHVIFADSCSAACEAVNDAARFFNVLQARHKICRVFAYLHAKRCALAFVPAS